MCVIENAVMKIVGRFNLEGAGDTIRSQRLDKSREISMWAKLTTNTLIQG